MLNNHKNFNYGKRTIPRVSSPVLLPLSAGFALASLMLTALYPIQAQEASAADDTGVATFSGWLSSSVALTMADSVSQTIEPTANGTFKNLSTTAKVQVANSDYYSLTLKGSPDMTSINGTNPTSTSNSTGNDGSTTTRSGNNSTTSTAKINAITLTSAEQAAGGKTSSNFTANTWGYNVTKNPSDTTSTIPATSTTIYKPVTSLGDTIPIGDHGELQKSLGDAHSASDTYTLNFGAKVDTTLPAGTYTSEITLSVVASPKQVTGFDRTDTMQGMTAEICREIGTDLDTSKDSASYSGIKAYDPLYDENASETDKLKHTYYTKRLKDTRDGKYYWVAKLADGNCWMTQNLALDIPATGLTSVDTALNMANADPETGIATWKPTEATRVVTIMSEEEKLKRFTLPDNDSWNKLDYRADYSWNEGNFVSTYPITGSEQLATSIKNVEQGGILGFATLPLKEYYTIADTNGVNINNYNILYDVSTGWTASTDVNFTTNSTYIAPDGNTYNKVPGLAIAINDNNKVYDTHYLIGNYYQYLATTAHTPEDESILPINTTIDGSICAKNWQLPTSGKAYNNKASLYSLIQSYTTNGVSPLAIGGEYGENADQNGGKSSTERIISNNVTTNDILAGAPMFFMRAGLIIPLTSNQSVRSTGGHGYYWPSVASGASVAHNFDIGPATVVPSSGAHRAHGFSVRCLVNTVE